MWEGPNRRLPLPLLVTGGKKKTYKKKKGMRVLRVEERAQWAATAPSVHWTQAGPMKKTWPWTLGKKLTQTLVDYQTTAPIG